MELNEILQVALRGGASDIHLKAGLPPMFRVDGSLVPLKDARRLPPEEISRMAFGIMNDYQKEKFKARTSWTSRTASRGWAGSASTSSSSAAPSGWCCG